MQNIERPLTGRFYYIWFTMSATKPYPSILQGFLLIIPFIAYQLLFYLGYKIFITQFDIASFDESVLEGMLYISMLTTLILFAYRRRKQSGITKGISFTGVPVRILVVSIVAMFCLDVMLDIFYYYFPPSESFIDWMKEEITGGWPSVLTIVVAAPVLEEILMRGIILDGFLKRYRPVVAIFWSALIFGAIHFNIWQGVSAFSFGLLAGWLYWRSGSLLLCMVLHAFGNGLAVLLNDIDTGDADTLTELIGVGWYIIVFTMAIIILISCIRYLHKHLRTQRVEDADISAELPV